MNHPFTPSPSELPGLLSGEVTEVWVRAEKQPKFYPSASGGCWGWPDGREPPYAVGDVLVVLKPVRDYHEPLADIEPDTAPFPTLTITAVTPQQRDGVWGFAYEVATTKGNDDE